jgi:thymidylate synthase/ubiquinone/menaquinone biosynthesis C-methylase UbiE
MKNTYSAETLEGIWLKTARAIIKEGGEINDEDPFKEILNLQISYSNAFETEVPEYLKIFGSEYLDYMSKIYSAGGDPKTGRDYHKLIYNQNGIDQVDRVIKKLQSEPLTRSATIVLASSASEKQPCVTEVNFSIRENFLQMNVVFKSSDIAKKFIPDMRELSRIHKHVSESLNVARGKVTALILCAQVYTKDIAVIKPLFQKRHLEHYFNTKKVIRNWNSEAAEWDENIQDPTHYVNIENGYERFVSFVQKHLLNTSLSEFVALDSGCGTGVIADILSDKAEIIVGIDIAPKMLEFAHKHGDIRYIQANSLDIPFAAESFDVICSRGVLISHVGKGYVDRFIEEHHRILKKGGLFVFDFITKFDSQEKSNRRTKAALSYKKLVGKLEAAGFDVIERSGSNLNRVNALLCKKHNQDLYVRN